jgi:sulfhydrogenase subunit gamma (sulfur reductase)
MSSAEPAAPARAAAPQAAVNPFRPRLMRIVRAWDETPDVRTLQLSPLDDGPRVRWEPGQFGEFSVFGAGEAVFTMANSPTRDDYVECGFRALGKVTGALRNLAVGQVIGYRGPYGNAFPVDAWKGRDLVFIGGGIGTVALRALLQWVLDHRADYGEILVLNGARSVADLCYKQEMPEWARVPGVRVVRTVDPGGETPGWDGEVGLLPAVFERQGVSAANRVVVTCGPPVMLHFLFQSLEKLGFPPESVVTTLENKMKCGLGLCGRCNVGRHYVCVDGPVFTLAQLQTMPKDY